VSKFDVIHAYTLFTDGNAAMKLAKKYHKPYIVAVRNTDVNVFFAKLFYLRHRGIEIMRNAKKIIFLSEAYRKMVFKKYVPQIYSEESFAKTEIIPNGINDFWFENAPENNNKILSDPVKLIYAGVINRNKNITTIQKAMAILRNEGLNSVLTVIGKVEDERELAIVKKDPYTTYLPAMSKESLIEQYRKNDIFVMPSFTETFGLVYVEAMSQGLPVIYSKGQGFDGQFGEGSVGFHCDAYDASDVANEIKKVVKNYSIFFKHNRIAAKMFNWMDISKEYFKIYRAINE
jgi:glycosyltransferase involved in cell wall biosynthesis